MTPVCRPTPSVRFMPMSETWLTATHALHGTILELGSIFTPGPKLANPPKRSLVAHVQKNYLPLLAQGAKNGNCFPPTGGAAYILRSKDRGLSPRSGKKRLSRFLLIGAQRSLLVSMYRFAIQLTYPGSRTFQRNHQRWAT